MSDKEAPELVNTIEKKDRWFRRSIWVMLGSMLVGLLILITIATHTLQAIHDQQVHLRGVIEEIRHTADKQDKLREQQLDKLNRHLDCIVILFQQPNRSEKIIEDINQCTLGDIPEGSAAIGQYFVSVPSGPQQQPRSAVPHPTTTNNQQPQPKPDARTPQPEPQPTEPPKEPEPAPRPSLLEGVVQGLLNTVRTIL